VLRVALGLRSTEVQPAFLGLLHPIARDSKPYLGQVFWSLVMLLLTPSFT
jgi:hypothetical protein